MRVKIKQRDVTFKKLYALEITIQQQCQQIHPQQNNLKSIILTSPHFCCCARIVQQTTTTTITTWMEFNAAILLPFITEARTHIQNVYRLCFWIWRFSIGFHTRIKSIASGAAVNKRVIFRGPNSFLVIKYTLYIVTWSNRSRTISVVWRDKQIFEKYNDYPMIGGQWRLRRF